MTTLEKVMQLKREGKTEPEIISVLKNQGTPPLEISDALNQSQIKEAIVAPNPTEGMDASIMNPMPEEKEGEREPPLEDLYNPMPTTTPQPPQTMAPEPSPMQTQEQYYDQYSQPDPFSTYQQQNQYQNTYSPQPMYDEYDQGGYSQSTDTMIEVAEQVFSEKIKKLTKEIKSLTEFKTIFEIKVENLSNRLERMEKHFDKMQLDILGKVSEYGKGLDYIRKELNMVENSIEKINSKT
jgi:hypothetical protein